MDYFVGPSGNDQNSGTSERNAWGTLAVSSRLKPGDTLLGLPGTITGTFNPPSGTETAPITFRAKDPGSTVVDGSVRIDGLAWSKIAKGWQVAFRKLAFNVFQRSFETDGKLANFNNRDWNQYGSNPQLDLHGTPAEFKWANGALRLNAIPSNPAAEPLFAATTEVAIDLNGRSHVFVEGITTRGHKHAVATNGGTRIRLIDCRFTFCGSTAVWLVGLADALMSGCTVQGAGSWGGHYEDLIHTERVGILSIVGCNLSYGGHSGLIMLDGIPGSVITLARLHFHHMGGSLLTLKRGVDNLRVEDCWFEGAAKSTAVDAHKVPHAGIQLSGKGHTFRNCVFRDNGKDVLASSDGNADSNPVCSDTLFERCTFSGSEAGAVEGQEYAPKGRLERMTWKDCIIRGNVELFYAGQGNRNSNGLAYCQFVGSTRGVITSDCSSNPLPNTGSTLQKPPTTQETPPQPPEPPVPPQTAPLLKSLTPSQGPPGTRVTAEGERFGTNAPVIVTTPVSSATPQGKRRVDGTGNDTRTVFTVPADAITGPVAVRRGTEVSNALTFTVQPAEDDDEEPPPSDHLRVSVALSAAGDGATFTGTVSDGGPLPPRSMITVVATTPDGRQGNARAVIPEEAPPESGEAAEVVRLVNAERAAHGLRALAAHAQLTAAATGHSRFMASVGQTTHTGAGGSMPAERIAGAGYRAVATGECVASGYETPASVVAAWLQSPPHRAILLTPGYVDIGVAMERSADRRAYWCLTVATPAAGMAMLSEG